MKEIEKVQSIMPEQVFPIKDRNENFLGSKHLFKGQKIYEYNPEDESIVEAEYEKVSYFHVKKSAFDLARRRTRAQGEIKKDLKMKVGCIYVVAINKASANKKILKLIKSK